MILPWLRRATFRVHNPGFATVVHRGYAHVLVGGRSRKGWRCSGCGGAIKKGDHAWRGLRDHVNLPRNNRICDPCVVGAP